MTLMHKTSINIEINMYKNAKNLQKMLKKSDLSLKYLAAIVRKFKCQL